MEFLYHGSSVSGIQALQPHSRLHGSDEQVVYLSGSIPYALVYIWNQKKTGTRQKWVTCWLKNGIVYYEEQFPGQLRAFYEGTAGYLYTVQKSDLFHSVSNRELMYFSSESVSVETEIYIPDVYKELCRFQKQGKFKLLKFEEASPQRQAALIQTVADCIRDTHALHGDHEESHFFKNYFKAAWQKAELEVYHGISKVEGDL